MDCQGHSDCKNKKHYDTGGRAFVLARKILVEGGGGGGREGGNSGAM